MKWENILETGSAYLALYLKAAFLGQSCISIPTNTQFLSLCNTLYVLVVETKHRRIKIDIIDDPFSKYLFETKTAVSQNRGQILHHMQRNNELPFIATGTGSVRAGRVH